MECKTCFGPGKLQVLCAFSPKLFSVSKKAPAKGVEPLLYDVEREVVNQQWYANSSKNEISAPKYGYIPKTQKCLLNKKAFEKAQFFFAGTSIAINTVGNRHLSKMCLVHTTSAKPLWMREPLRPRSFSNRPLRGIAVRQNIVHVFFVS